jgi:hypothetical protein
MSNDAAPAVALGLAGPAGDGDPPSGSVAAGLEDGARGEDGDGEATSAASQAPSESARSNRPAVSDFVAWCTVGAC